ncbi:MAG: flagellar filament capping protein FliD [Planctomycetota bacterium]
MSYGSIQIGGLASGLDTSAIISALLALESRPLQLLEAQKETEQERISLWGTLEGLVETLQQKAQEFTSSTGSFFAHTVTAADEGLASFTVTGAPASGGHTLTVTSLASADRWAFDGVADAGTTDLGAGTVSFDYGGTSYSIAVDAAASTLNEIAAAISTAVGDEVAVAVINAGTETSPSYQLVLTGSGTGADHQITNLSSTVAGLVNPVQLTDASNAQITIDGLAVERSTNVFSDVVEGLSFTVQGLGTTTFSSEVDVEGTKEKFREFVDAYNAVIQFVNGQNSYDEENGPGGPLFGDYGLLRVVSAIKSAVFSADPTVVLGDTEGYSTLGLLGIDIETDGTLSIDDETFEAKLTGDLGAFGAFFTDETSGVLVLLDEAIDDMVDGGTNAIGQSYDGLFDGKRSALNSLVNTLDDRIERMEYNLERLEDRLVAQYANLESLMTGLNAQAAYLAQGLAFPTLG